MGKYGVFTLHNGQWRLVGRYKSVLHAEMEVRYLEVMLGLTARIFVKHPWSDHDVVCA